ncbi:MAG: YiiX/YebB-like N1pC/P60 family cysteine hydrolase [Bdellovibrionota bacterium]
MKFWPFFKIILFSFFVAIQVEARPAVPAELQNFSWQTGDVIGISELFTDWSTFFFEAATGSRYGHVGIVSVETDGVYVFEENDPYAQKTKLDSFLGTAGKNPVTKKILASIMRPKQALSSAELEKILWAANEAVTKKIPYNHSQMMNLDSLNCSEFVRAVYAFAGREVGKIEKLGALNVGAFNGWMLKAWEYQGNKTNMENLVVSPMSIILSDSLYPVYANLPTDYYLSDRQLYNAWKAEGFINELSQQTHVPKMIINFLGKRSSDKPWRVQPKKRVFQ